MTTDRYDNPARAAGLRVYRRICVVMAALAAGSSVWAFATGLPDVGWTSLVLVVLLAPAYLLVARTPTRRAGGVGSSGTRELTVLTDDDGAGTIVVVRPSGYLVDVFRRYRIVLDGQQAGTVARGGSLSLVVRPGPHVVAARIDWAGSRDVAVDVPPRATVTLAVTPGSPTGVFSSSGEYLFLAPER